MADKKLIKMVQALVDRETLPNQTAALAAAINCSEQTILKMLNGKYEGGRILRNALETKYNDAMKC